MLILPTFFKGEGYPGVIVEAFSLGLPVISTNWRCIPELITNDVNGYLVEAKSYEDLKGAVEAIGSDNYNRLSKGAIDSFNKHFDIEKVNKNLLEQINTL